MPTIKEIILLFSQGEIPMKEELLKGLSEEQIAKFKACKSQEELLEIAKEEGLELNEEQLEAVSGGCGTFTAKVSCPKCGCNKLRRSSSGDLIKLYYLECSSCGHKWLES